MNEHTLANDWKTANVKAIYKKGDKTLPENQRPVSLTCLPCKIVEKPVRDGIVNFMNRNNLFSDAQFGFRSLRSCALQLLEVMEKWTSWIDNNENFDCVYYDFRKAFDSVPHMHVFCKK